MPIQYWAAENLGRIGRKLGKLVYTNRLIVHGERISYEHMVIEIDITQVLSDHIYIEIAENQFKQ